MNTPHKPTALVTGATSGIGQAIATRLAESGYVVLALGRARAVLDEMAEVDGVCPLALDVTDRDAVIAAVDGKAIDVLVNNAGIMPPNRPFTEQEQGDIDATLTVNLSSVLFLTRHVLPAMVARKSGHVFFTGSTAGHAPFPNMAVYGASKAAISSFASALRGDLSGSGVRVTEIVAGRVETALYRDALGARERAHMYEAFDAVQPDDVARMVVAALEMPAHVDVTRFDILPTAQYVGGGGAAAKR